MLKCSLTMHILVMLLVLTLLLEQTRKRPFGVFVGFNQFRETVVFGVVFMYDEIFESFKWLFETFLKTHDGKQPKTIYTDQDSAMVKVVKEVFLEAWHGVVHFPYYAECCKTSSWSRRWRIQPKHTIEDNKKKTSILTDFSACICLSTKMRKHLNKHLTP